MRSQASATTAGSDPALAGRPGGAVLFDVDGTLVDTAYHHALAWYRAFREMGIVEPIWRIHRHVGMGGDQLVPALLGDQVDAEIGDRLRAGWRRHYEPLLGEVSAFEGAHELLAALVERGHELVLASSSPGEHLDRYLELLDARDLVAHVTTADDVEATKPAPDIVEVACARASAAPLVLVGDAPWDIEAARRAGLACVALVTGGYCAQELAGAGAAAVCSSLVELRRHWDELVPTHTR